MADDDYQDFGGDAGMDLGGDGGDFGIDDIEQSNNIEVRSLHPRILAQANILSFVAFPFSY